MKHLIVLGLSLFCLGAVCADETSIVDIAVRQRWPWSPKVDVTYRYDGEAPTSVCFTATWRGQDTPVNIVSCDSTGTFLVKPGAHRFAWDPVAAGHGADALVDFRVEASVVAADPRTYLVADLANGGYELLPDVPAGGWTDAHKTSKMVFRRIPAGTYQLGYPEDDFYRLEAESGWSRPVARSMMPRTVTLSSDYYCAIFLTTASQLTYLRDDSTKLTAKTPQRSHVNYAAFRGATLADGVTAVDWPNTGHAVAADSFVGLLRAKLGGKLLADLPTQEQWEIAMRAETATLWPSGGSPADTAEELTNALHAISWCRWIDGDLPYSHDVGLKACNAWGLYDFNVVDQGEVTLSYANDAAEITHPDKKTLDVSYPVGGLDPIGPASSIHAARIFMGGCTYGSDLTFRIVSTPARTGLDVSTGETLYCGVRFVINLKPLVE